jgi:hypothetical protein
MQPLRIQWAPKIRRSKLFRLYQQDALGLLDEELLADIGYSLLARCRSILMVTEACQVDCPACQTLITCHGLRWSRDTGIVCPSCGWKATYGQWRDSWRHSDLTGGNAMAFYRAYLEEFPKAKIAPERMLLIDHLIHEFHWSIRHQRSHAPLAGSLIEGSPQEVLAFLDTLTYGRESTPGLQETGAEWRKRLETVAGKFPFLRERMKMMKGMEE